MEKIDCWIDWHASKRRWINVFTVIVIIALIWTAISNGWLQEASAWLCQQYDRARRQESKWEKIVGSVSINIWRFFLALFFLLFFQFMVYYINSIDTLNVLYGMSMERYRNGLTEWLGKP